MRRTARVSLFAILAVSSCDAIEPGEPATIVTVAGTGIASFNGDGLPPLESGLYAPIQVFFDEDDRPVIVDWNNHRVRAITELGLLTVVGDGVEGGAEPNELTIAFSVHHPFQFTLDAGGMMYFAGYHDPRVFRVDPNQRVALVAGNGSAGHSGDGFPAELAFLGSPTGVAVAADGTVYLADEAYHDIRRVDPDGIIHHFAGTATSGYSGDGGPASEASLRSPSRLAFDGAGNLYVCDTGNHVVRMIDPSGVITTIAGTGEAGYGGDGGSAHLATFNRPIDIAIRPEGGYLIADSNNHVIRLIDEAGMVRTVAGTGVEGFSGDGGPAIEAALHQPQGVAIGSDGSVWIADSYNHRVRKIGSGDGSKSSP
jgi:sugar lactone lactonase YvrE